MQNQREFTESWLQALTLSADHSHARSIRPWLTTIQTLAASAPNAEQAQEAEKLWEYASGHGLLSLITCSPARSTPWRFEDDECYKFSPVDSSSIEREPFGHTRNWVIEPCNIGPRQTTA